MRSILASLTMLLALAASAQPSYWFQQFQKQGNAQYAQQYFATNGPGIAFSFDGVHWVISATGTNYTVATSTNAVYSQYSTNWFGSNAFYLLLSGQITNYTAGSNVTFTATGTHTYRIDSTGGGGTTTGLTTNICVVLCDATTNTLSFTNGLLMAINSGGPPHGPSWIWPGGGHILWPNGGYILLP